MAFSMVFVILPLLALIRILLFWPYRKDSTRLSYETWKSLYFLLTFGVGLTLSVGYAFYYPHIDQPTRFFLLVVIAAAIPVGAFVYAAHFRTALAYEVASALPVVISHLFLEENLATLLAIFSLLYVLVMAQGTFIYSKTIHDSLQLKFEKDDLIEMLQETLNETLDFCEEKLKQADIDLIKKIPEQEILLQGIPIQLSQVFLNIINNAVDAIKDDEKFMEKESYVEIEALEKDEKVFVHISNNGPKIPDSVMEKILLPFFTTKEVGKGTGLGLSLTKGIIENHHGELKIDSTEEKTTFTIILPA